MFRREARRVGFALADGQAVLARGTITVYEARGQYQIQVAEIRPRGQGEPPATLRGIEAEARGGEPFRARTEAAPAGFSRRSSAWSRRCRARCCRTCCKFSSGARRAFAIRVRGVRVQGIGAAQEIAEAIAAFSAEKNVDLLVVARGGGSLEDLWAFNEEVVARALAACSVPTISAVGHETDFTIADFVADLRAPTPSAAAELLTRDWNEWREDRGQTSRATGPDNAAGSGRSSPTSGPAGFELCACANRAAWCGNGRRRLDDLQRKSLRRGAQRRSNRGSRNCACWRRGWRRIIPRGAGTTARSLAQLAARLRDAGTAGHARPRLCAGARCDRGIRFPRRRRRWRGKPVRIVLSKGMIGASLTEAQPEKTLIDALRPQVVQLRRFLPRKEVVREKGIVRP